MIGVWILYVRSFVMEFGSSLVYVGVGFNFVIMLALVLEFFFYWCWWLPSLGPCLFFLCVCL